MMTKPNTDNQDTAYEPDPSAKGDSSGTAGDGRPAEVPEDGDPVQDGAAAPTADAAEAPVTVETLQERIRDLEDRLLRTRAEVQNVQRRGEQERREAVRYANAELMRRLIAVVDDMERALGALDEAERESPVNAGVRLVYENLLKALREFGMMPVEALHHPFDPHVHEALMRRPSADHPEGTVIEELAKGYVLHERTLRPAKVIVAARSEE